VAERTDVVIGERVRQRRISLGLSQDALAGRLQAAGIAWSQGTLSKVENGDRPVRLSETPSLATVLDLPWYQLLESADPISNAWARIDRERRELRKVLLDAGDREMMFKLSQAGLDALKAVTEGRTAKTSFTSERFCGMTFKEMKLYEVIDVMAQLGVDHTMLARELPDGYNDLTTARTAVVSVEFSEACGPLIAAAVPNLEFRARIGKVVEIEEAISPTDDDDA